MIPHFILTTTHHSHSTAITADLNKDCSGDVICSHSLCSSDRGELLVTMSSSRFSLVKPMIKQELEETSGDRNHLPTSRGRAYELYCSWPSGGRQWSEQKLELTSQKVSAQVPNFLPSIPSAHSDLLIKT